MGRLLIYFDNQFEALYNSLPAICELRKKIKEESTLAKKIYLAVALALCLVAFSVSTRSYAKVNAYGEEYANFHGFINGVGENILILHGFNGKEVPVPNIMNIENYGLALRFASYYGREIDISFVFFEQGGIWISYLKLWPLPKARYIH